MLECGRSSVAARVARQRAASTPGVAALVRRSVKMRSKRDLLRRIAKKYVWWKDPDDGSITQRYLVARVMNMGTDEDLLAIEEAFGIDALRDALRNAEAGWFDNWRTVRSWRYWHRRLGLVVPGEDPPPLPKRPFL